MALSFNRYRYPEQITAQTTERLHAAWEQALEDVLPDLVLARKAVKRRAMELLKEGNPK